MCHPTNTLHSPVVGAVRKTHGQATSQLQDSKYVPVIFQSLDIALLHSNRSGQAELGPPSTGRRHNARDQSLSWHAMGCTPLFGRPTRSFAARLPALRVARPC